MRVRRAGAQPYKKGRSRVAEVSRVSVAKKSVGERWRVPVGGGWSEHRRSQRAPDESRRSSENSRRGARARGPASCGGVEQAASWSGRTALRRSSDVAEVVNGSQRASTKRSKDPFTPPKASPARPDRPGRGEGRTTEGNRASRSPSCSSRPVAQATGALRHEGQARDTRGHRPEDLRAVTRSGQVTCPASCEPSVIQAPSWYQGSRARFFSGVLYESVLWRLVFLSRIVGSVRACT